MIDNSWTQVPEIILGRPIQVCRVGPIFDRFTGELCYDFTDEILAGMTHVFFQQKAEGVHVPVDFAHGCEDEDPTPERSQSYGEVLSLDHRLGLGLWAEVAWTPEGVELIQKNDGVLWISPAFVDGPAYSKQTGRLLGENQLLSVALTNRPMQDSIERVLMVETSVKGGIMPDKIVAPPSPQAPAAVAPPVPPVDPNAPVPEAPVVDPNAPASLEEALAVIAAKDEEIAQLKAALEAATATMDMTATDAKIQATESARQIKSLSERVLAMEMKSEIDTLIHKGTIAPATRAFAERLYRADRKLFTEFVTTKVAKPEVDLTVHGVSGSGEGNQAAVKLFRDTVKARQRADGGSYEQAFKAVASEKPDLYALIGHKE